MPLLSSELVVTPDGTQLAYATPPEAVQARVLALFERGLQRLQVRGKGALQKRGVGVRSRAMGLPAGWLSCCQHL